MQRASSWLVSRAEQGDTHKWPVKATVTCSSRGRMRNSQIFVGRHPSCELTIDHRAVSTSHCSSKSSITLITAEAQAACLRRENCMSAHRNHYDIAILKYFMGDTRPNQENKHTWTCSLFVHFCKFWRHSPNGSGDICHIGVVCGYRPHPLACHISRSNIDSMDQCHM